MKNFRNSFDNKNFFLHSNRHFLHCSFCFIDSQTMNNSELNRSHLQNQASTANGFRKNRVEVIREAMPHVEINGHQIAAHHLEKGSHPMVSMIIPPKLSPPTTALTQASQFEFELSKSSFLIADRESMWLEIKVAETGGLNTITPTFVEDFFDRTKAIEFMMNSQVFYTVNPFQIAVEPAIIYDHQNFGQYVNGTNHSSALASNSVNSISAGGSAVYYMRIPNPFPEDGLWLYALKENKLIIRFYTQSAVSAGSGTLALSEVNLILDGYFIPQDEWAELDKHWENRVWRCFKVHLNDIPSITFSSSGTTTVELKNCNNIEAVAGLTAIRASRSNTSTANWTLTAINNTAKVDWKHQSGASIFYSTPLSYFKLRYLDPIKFLGTSQLLVNQPLIPLNIDSLFKVLTSNHVDGSYHFTGDERLEIQASGSSSTLFVDTYLWVPQYLKMDASGFISIVVH